MTPPVLGSSTPEGRQQEISSLPEKTPVLGIMAQTRLALLAAMVTLGVAGKPQEVQADQAPVTENAVFIVPVSGESETLTDEDIAKIEEAIPRFNADLNALIPEERQIEGVDFSQILDTFDTSKKQRVIALYIAGMNVSKAVKQVYYSHKEQTPDVIRIRYADIIDLGRQEYILRTLASEKFTTGRFSKKDEAWKITKATEYFEEYLSAYLSGNNTGGTVTTELAQDAPTLAYAFIDLGVGSPQMQEELSISMQGVEAEARTAEAEARTAEAQAIIDKQNKIQEELRTLIDTLQANS